MKRSETEGKSGDSSGVAAVDRALTIIDAFRGGDGTLSLAQLSSRTGLYKSTILRLSLSLEQFNYLRRLGSGNYQLGPAFLELADLYRGAFRLENYVVPSLRALVDKTDESASYYVRDKDDRLCLFRVESSQAVRDHVRVGDRLPLALGAGGKVLTTFAEPDACVGRAKEDFVIATFGERQPDTAAVAAPVFGADNELNGAIGISGPRNRFTKSMVAAAAKVVFDEARQLSITLGATSSIFPSG